jgi:hypothetical protein
VSLGWFRPLRDQRLQEPALLAFRFEPNTHGEFRAGRAEIVAPALAIASAAAASSTRSVCAGHRHATRMFAERARPALLLQSLGPSLRRAVTARRVHR